MSRAKGRRAPKTGYDFGNKRRYRRDVWGGIRDICKLSGLAPANARVAFLPSIEMDEIRIAKRFGFIERNMRCIDRSPGIAAHFVRRYPGVKAHGKSVECAFQDIAKSGVTLHAANLDLCGPIGKKLGDTIQKTMQTNVIESGGALAITMLRGRESGIGRSWLESGKAIQHRYYHNALSGATVTPRKLSDTDAGRVEFLNYALHCGGYAGLVNRIGSYKSGTQTMLWVLFKVYKGAGLARLFDEQLQVTRLRFDEEDRRYGYAHTKKGSFRVIGSAMWHLLQLRQIVDAMGVAARTADAYARFHGTADDMMYAQILTDIWKSKVSSMPADFVTATEMEERASNGCRGIRPTIREPANYRTGE